jgi:glycine oxidase
MKVAVIGAGLSGRLLAWQLLEQGISVSLFDKDDGTGAQSAGIVAAAMLAPFAESLDAEETIYQQGIKSLALWQRWAEQLLEKTGVDIHLNLTGSLLVSHRQDMGDYQLFTKRLQTLPFIDQAAISHIEKTELAKLEPELAECFDKACYISQEGALDNVALFKALEKRLKDLQVDWQYGAAIDDIEAKIDNGNFDGFDKIVDCRGFGAAKELNGLRGVRGEVIRVRAPEVNISRPVRLMHPRYKLYICPKPNNEYVIGATQIESASENNITVRSSLELLSALYSLHTGFAEAEILSQAARCRPAFVDNLAKVEAVNSRLIRLNGLYRHGYLIGPAIIEQALALVLADECSDQSINSHVVNG